MIKNQLNERISKKKFNIFKVKLASKLFEKINLLKMIDF